MSDIDHLYEATQHVGVTPNLVDHHLQRAQAHALIAIAQELRWMNERENRKEWDPLSVINDYSAEQLTEIRRIREQGDYQSTVYPFGRQP